MELRTASQLATVAVMCTLAMACSKKVKEMPPPPARVDSTVPMTDTSPMSPRVAGAYSPGDLDTDSCLRQRIVYFELDQDTVKPEFQATVACHAKYLRDRTSSRMTLEGHADERGSRDYNMALGERRANGLSSAMQASGGSASQITANTFGEEKPVCTDSGEDCWSRNRRVEISYSQR